MIYFSDCYSIIPIFLLDFYVFCSCYDSPGDDFVVSYLSCPPIVWCSKRDGQSSFFLFFLSLSISSSCFPFSQNTPINFFLPFLSPFPSPPLPPGWLLLYCFSFLFTLSFCISTAHTIFSCSKNSVSWDSDRFFFWCIFYIYTSVYRHLHLYTPTLHTQHMDLYLGPLTFYTSI